MNNKLDRLQGFSKSPPPIKETPTRTLTFALCEIIGVSLRWKDTNECRFREAHVSVPSFTAMVRREISKLSLVDFCDKACDIKAAMFPINATLPTPSPFRHDEDLCKDLEYCVFYFMVRVKRQLHSNIATKVTAPCFNECRTKSMKASLFPAPLFSLSFSFFKYIYQSKQS